MAKCIVTGGLGFIGSHLVEKLLAQGDHVVVIDDISTGRLSNISAIKKHPNLVIHNCALEDIEDSGLMYFNDAEYIFHLAARAAIIPSIEFPVSYYKANVTGTLQVLEAARHSKKLRKFIYTASSSCYGLNGKGPNLNPQYPYALTKLMGEQLVLHWKHVYKIPAISLRLFNVYGPRAISKSSYGAMFGTFLTQKLAEVPLTVVGDGKQCRDFVYVSDVVDALLASRFASPSIDHADIGTGVAPTILEIAQAISDKIVHIPKRPGEPDKTLSDAVTAWSYLNWEAKIQWQEGVKLMLDHIEEWKSAQIWNPDSIEKATASWFQFLM